MDIDTILSLFHRVRTSIYQKQIITRRDTPFRLKSGQESCYYIDLRLCLQYPDLMRQCVQLYGNLINQVLSLLAKQDINGSKVMLCGVPLGALPFASQLAQTLALPMIFCREKRKSYGQQRMIEGMHTNDLAKHTCIIIEDVVTTGGSVREVVEQLEQQNIHVAYIVSFVCRMVQPIPDTLCGVPYRTVCHMDDLLPTTIDEAMKPRGESNPR